MPLPDPDQEKARQDQDLSVWQQIAFASGLFQGDVTVRTLLESLAEGLVIINHSGFILLVNSRAEQMFGYQTAELIGKPHAALIPERFRKVHDEHMSRYFAAPTTRSMGEFLDLAGLRQDGSEFPLALSLSFIETAGGIFVLALVSDITLRKEYEKRLLETEEMFHIHASAVKDYAIFTLDTAGRVLKWNAGAERLHGYPAEEVIGRHFSCFYPEEERTTGKPGQDLQEAAARGQVVAEGYRLRRDGSRFWAENKIIALYAESGELRGFTKVTHDISAYQNAQEALRKSEEKFSKIFQSVPVIISITSMAEGRCIDINDNGLQTLGFQRDEVVGRTMLELGVWESSTVRDRVLRGLEENGAIRDLEIHFRAKNGRTIIGLYSAEPIVLNGEQYLINSVKDITDQKVLENEILRLNADMETANKELEAFNYTVAHDLRQPLNALNSYCQVIDRLFGDQLPEGCKEYLQDAYQVTLRMNRLIEVLLNFSRVGSVEPRREAVDLGMLARESALSLQLVGPERKVEFRIAEGVVAQGDVSLLRMVLDNLLGNAWKYTASREQAVIEFGARVIDGALTYFVKDNGSGFDMADAGKIFSPFQRLPGAEKREGFGVGLATVERIIRRHGGKVWAEGEPDHGACFFFTLGSPLRQGEERRRNT
jgi:PAS domain S-box-containing protein